MNKRVTLLIGACIMLAAISQFAACKTPEPVRVIGYLPAWKDLRQSVDRTDLSQVTHINIAFLNPDASGVVDGPDGPPCMSGATADDLHYVVAKAHQARVKVLISLAGGVIPPCSGDWEVLLQPASQQQLVDDLVAFVADFDLDGIDVDLEGVLLTAIHAAGNYTPFVTALSERLHPQGKLVTCATASYEGGMIPVESIPLFDFVNIMSYDTIGPSWGQAGSEHSSLEQSLAHLETWRSRGLPKEKLVLGLPFYGYGFGDQRGGYSYQEILDEHGMSAASTDLIGTACADCSYVTYNGRQTIRRKTQLALREGSGVMIWELSQDALSPDDLLGVIHEVVDAAR
ncbi:MAG: glycosyl hydrolase family 18 [Gemmatimonadetes bacterium]|jgi:GH18 family chitinase|nr:glycosyl hydrolase family 18 [Gemmatimonadota bacterium]